MQLKRVADVQLQGCLPWIQADVCWPLGSTVPTSMPMAATQYMNTAGALSAARPVVLHSFAAGVTSWERS